MFGRRTTSENPPAGPDLSNPADDLVDPPSLDLDTEPEAEALWAPAAGNVRKSVEQILLDAGHIQEEQLTQAKQVQSQTPGKTVTQILLTMNAATEGQILAAQAENLGLTFEVPEKAAVEQQAFELLEPDYIRRHFVLPIRMDGKAVVVGMADPANV